MTTIVSDAELTRRIQDGQQPDGPTATAVRQRLRAAVLAYARSCCVNRRVAAELANEAFRRAGEVVGSDDEATECRLPRLLAEVRNTAADWADSERRSVLSTRFTRWVESLPQPMPEKPSARAAVAAAESDSLLLRAFRSLSDPHQADVWRCLAEQTGRLAASPPEADTLTRQRLQDVYLKIYASQAPQRSCRHLAARLGDSVRRGIGGEATDLDRHLAGCDSCRRARAELAAIRGWQRSALLPALLLWTAEPSAPPAPAAAASSRGSSPARRPSASRARPRRPWPGGRAGRRDLLSLAATGGGVLAALVIAGVILAAVDSAGEHPSLGGALVFPTPERSASPTVSPSASPATTPTAASPSPSPATPTSASAAPPAPAPPPPAKPSPSAAVGVPLVNLVSGLCVGITDGGAGGPLQLQPCNGGPSQGWERLAADQGSYQLRNTGTGTCLDGTSGGGDNVVVTLHACRTDAGRAEQLWRFEPDQRSGLFRLWFVPPVPAGDYPEHLLGPQDWPKGDPPRPGSILVHLPDYYDSSSFLFSMG